MARRALLWPSPPLTVPFHLWLHWGQWQGRSQGKQEGQGCFRGASLFIMYLYRTWFPSAGCSAPRTPEDKAKKPRLWAPKLFLFVCRARWRGCCRPRFSSPWHTELDIKAELEAWVQGDPLWVMHSGWRYDFPNCFCRKAARARWRSHSGGQPQPPSSPYLRVCIDDESFLSPNPVVFLLFPFSMTLSPLDISWALPSLHKASQPHRHFSTPALPWLITVESPCFSDDSCTGLALLALLHLCQGWRTLSVTFY